MAASTPQSSGQSLSKELEDALECAICLQVCIRPCSTACGHTYCRRCLRMSLASDPQRRCPTCRHDLRQTDLVVNRALWTIIQRLYPERCAEAPESPALPDPPATTAASRPGPSRLSRTSDLVGPAYRPFIPPRRIQRPEPPPGITFAPSVLRPFRPPRSANPNQTQFLVPPREYNEGGNESVEEMIAAMEAMMAEDEDVRFGESPASEAAADAEAAGEAEAEEVIDLTVDEDVDDASEEEENENSSSSGSESSGSSVVAAAAPPAPAAASQRPGSEGSGEQRVPLRPRQVVSGLFYGPAQPKRPSSAPARAGE